MEIGDLRSAICHLPSAIRHLPSAICHLPSAIGHRLPAISLLLAAFALLYLFTLDNGLRPEELRGGDLITHQYAQAQGRPSNAPGYPLYTMGGWLWFRLGRLIFGPHANPIPLLSSYSTLWALLALWLLYQLILEATRPPVTLSAGASPSSVVGRRSAPFIALLVTAFYGVTYFFWYYAVTTEQYTSAVAWTLAATLLAFRWERARRDGYLLALAFLAGVALAHMLTLLIIMPPLLWFVLRIEPKLLRRPKLIACAIGLAALPLLSYSYVYVAGAQHPEWRGMGQWASAWQWFWSFVSTQQGRSELTWSLTPFFTHEFPSLIWGELTAPGLIVGLLGLATVGRRRAVVMYATLLLYLVFCWIDRLGNWFQVIMPAYALVAVGLAAGTRYVDGKSQIANRKSQIADQDSQNAPRTTHHAIRNTQYAIRATLLLALVSLIIYRGALSYPRADSRDRPADTGLAAGWAILADEPAPETGILGTVDEMLALNYLTEIWGERPDVRSVTSSQARALLAQGRPLAVTQAALQLVPAEINPDAHFNALGRTLVAVSAAPRQTLPADLLPWVHDFGPELRLAGGRATCNPATGETVALLVWQVKTQPAADWSVSVRLTQAGREIAQLDRQHPVAGAYPTSRWSPGEVVGDAYPFALAPNIVADGVTIILYRRTADGGFVNLDVARFQIN